MQKFTTALVLFFTMAMASSAWSASVSRGQFTTDVIDREPVDMIDTLSSDNRQLKYFTELSDLQGQTVTHQWVYNGDVMFEKSFEVGGPRWRVWTSKTLQPGQSGTWTVHTLDAERTQIMTQSFEYQ